MNQKCILIALIIFKYYSLIDPDVMHRWHQYCNLDFEFCPRCFDQHIGISSVDEQINCCDFWHKNIESLTGSLATNINSMFGGRTVELATWKSKKSNVPVVLKYTCNADNLNHVKKALCQRVQHKYLKTYEPVQCDIVWKLFTNDSNKKSFLAEELKHLFTTNQWADGITLCPIGSSITEFTQTFNHFTNEATFWMHVLVNPELIVLQAFQQSKQLQRFVPKVLSWCGFIIAEEYAGKSLYEFYDYSMKIRIFLAKQLLEAAIAFSHGINGFRYEIVSLPSS